MVSTVQTGEQRIPWISLWLPEKKQYFLAKEHQCLELREFLGLHGIFSVKLSYLAIRTFRYISFT